MTFVMLPLMVYNFSSSKFTWHFTQVLMMSTDVATFSLLMSLKKKETDSSVLFVLDVMTSDRSYKTHSHTAFIQRSSMLGLIASFLVSKTDFNNKYFKMEIEAI